MDGLKLKSLLIHLMQNKPLELSLISLSIITIVISLALLFTSFYTSEAPIAIVNAKTSTKNTEKELYIDVSGAVNDPGIYIVDEGARIYEVIQKAGGLSESADLLYVQRSINQSKKLRDEEKIFLPFATEQTNTTLTNNSIETPTKILINSASTTLLESLPGIGKVTAENIVNHRPYSAIDELVEKKVLTTRVFEQVKDLIEL